MSIFEDQKYKELLKHTLTLFKWLFIGYIGSCLGVGVSWGIIGGFALMICGGIFNIYFAFIFFVVGAAYTYRLLGKKRI